MQEDNGNFGGIAPTWSTSTLAQMINAAWQKNTMFACNTFKNENR